MRGISDSVRRLRAALAILAACVFITFVFGRGICYIDAGAAHATLPGSEPGESRREASAGSDVLQAVAPGPRRFVPPNAGAGGGIRLVARIVNSEGNVVDSSWKILYSPGSICAEDFDDAGAMPVERVPNREDLLNFTNFSNIRLNDGGRVGPIEIQDAAGCSIVAWSGEQLLQWRGLRPERAGADGIWDAGTLRAGTSTSLILHIDNSGENTHYSAILNRLNPSHRGSDLYTTIAQLSPETAAAAFHGAPLPPNERDDWVLAPLPEGGEWSVTLLAPNGARSAPASIQLVEGARNNIILKSSQLFRAEDLSETTIRGRILTISGAPAPNVLILDEARNRQVKSDAQGAFQLEHISYNNELILQLSGFDAARPARQWRTPVQLPANPATEELIITIPRDHWIHARGAARPEGVDAAEPLAWLLEKADADGVWRVESSELFEPAPGGVNVLLTNNSGVYRVGAVWTPLFIQYSWPVEAGRGADDPSTQFMTDQVGIGYLNGIVVSAAGAPQRGAMIEIQGPVSGVPPITIYTNKSGKFTIFPVNAPTILARCSSEAGTAELELAASACVPELYIRVAGK